MATPPKPVISATSVVTNLTVTNPVTEAVIGTAATTATTLIPSNPSISSRAPGVAVTVPNQSRTVTFSLVVTDNLGQQSQPATFSVSIQPTPVAKLTATPTVSSAGGVIQFSGRGSVSGGTIAKFKFTLLPSTVTG
jgi:hypothetical protein